MQIFNKLPVEIKNASSNLSKFKSVLKKFLNTLILYYRSILKVIIICVIFCMSCYQMFLFYIVVLLTCCSICSEFLEPKYV
jgi:hypothetical protein